MKKRVVVTGIGVVSSIGIGKKDFWKALTDGKSGITKIESFDTGGYPNHFGGEIKNFSPEEIIGKDKAKALSRSSSLALSATKLALIDSGLDLSQFNKEDIGISAGTTMGESKTFERLNASWVKGGLAALEADLIPQVPAYSLSTNIAREFGLEGYNYIIPTACAAGNYAIGYAFDILRNNKAEIMFAAGVDGFSKIAFTGFNRLLAIAPEICQPFDKNRKGMMVGEGAGVLVLEPLENALKRNANIYAEILGYGLSCDAYHMTAPQAEGVSWAVENALRESGIGIEDVDYISAHGTGTPANDKEECLAIKNVFKDRNKKIPISSIKSMLGHTMGAASAIEAVSCCLALKEGILPPTINFQTPDPDCDIDCIPNQARRQKINIALNNAFAFGGNNSCLALRKYPI